MIWSATTHVGMASAISPPEQPTSSLVIHLQGILWASHLNKAQREAEKATLQPTPSRHTIDLQRPPNPATRTAKTAGTGTTDTLAHSLATTNDEDTKTRSATMKDPSPALSTPSPGHRHPVTVYLCLIQIRGSGVRMGTHVGRGHMVVVLLGHMRRPCRRWATGDIDLVVVAHPCAVRSCEILPGAESVIVDFERANWASKTIRKRIVSRLTIIVPFWPKAKKKTMRINN
jgi:hypothetical protein